MVQKQNLVRLQQAVNAVDTLYKEMKYGEMTVEVFKLLQSNQHSILQLTQISSHISRDQFNRVFQDRHEELQIYRKFVTDTSQFWSIFRFQVAIKGGSIKMS